MTLLWKIKDFIRKSCGGGYCDCAEIINPELTVISSNCTGSLICHEIGIRFNSPFVNLWIQPGDFVKLLGDLQRYMSKPLEFIKDDELDYPVAMLGDVKIYFQHYKTKEDAEAKWEQRRQRMNYDHLCAMMVEKDGCTYEDIRNFDALPIENKVVFTYKDYPEFPSAFYVKGFERGKAINHMYEFESLFSLKKYYYQFDTIDFLKGV